METNKQLNTNDLITENIENLSIIGKVTDEEMEIINKLMSNHPCHHAENNFELINRLHLYSLIDNSERYKNFVILEKPIPFREFVEKFAEGADIELIQLHDTAPVSDKYPNEIVGFCGACAWKDGALVSLDGDSYSDKMLIYGYEWFENEKAEIEKGLDILVKEW